MRVIPCFLQIAHVVKSCPSEGSRISSPNRSSKSCFEANCSPVFDSPSDSLLVALALWASPEFVEEGFVSMECSLGSRSMRKRRENLPAPASRKNTPERFRRSIRGPKGRKTQEARSAPGYKIDTPLLVGYPRMASGSLAGIIGFGECPLARPGRWPAEEYSYASLGIAEGPGEGDAGRDQGEASWGCHRPNSHPRTHSLRSDLRSDGSSHVSRNFDTIFCFLFSPNKLLH